MGNAAILGHGILLHVDRPLVPDLQPEENVVVELNINGQLITIEEWPSQSVAVPPPVEGVLKIRVYAQNQDDTLETRELGHSLVPITVCEIFQLPCFQVYLGLLNPGTMPSDLEPDYSVAKTVFETSMTAARTPGTPKVNVLFAACEETEDACDFVRELHDKPLMRLLSHSANIIKDNFVTETLAMSETMRLHREFASKAKTYEEVMNNAWREKHEMQERARTARALAAELMFSTLMGSSADFGFRLWKHHFHDVQKQRLRGLKKIGFEKLRHALKDMLEPDPHFRLEYAFRCWVVLHKSLHFPVKGVDLKKLGEPIQIVRSIEGPSTSSDQMFIKSKTSPKAQDAGTPETSPDAGVKTVDVVHGAHVGILHEHKTMHELLKVELAATQQQHLSQMSKSADRQASCSQSIRQSVDKWVLAESRGEAKGVIFQWHLAVLKAKKRRQDMKATQQWLGHVLDSEKRLLLAHVWFCWFKCFNGSKERRMAEEERQRIQELNDFERVQVHEDAAMRMSEAERKHEAARKNVELVLRKWEAGASAGLVSEVFAVWHKYTMKNVAYCKQHAAVEASLRKFLEGGAKAAVHTTFLYWHKYSAKVKDNRVRTAATHSAMLKFLEGERMGNMHSCFQHWESHWKNEKIHDLHDSKQNENIKEMQYLISDAKRKYDDQLEKEKTDKRAAFAYCMQSWEKSENEAAVWQTFHAWLQRAQHAAQHGRARQAVHAALLQAMEGQARAAVQLCFINWASDAKHCRIQRKIDQEAEKRESFADELRANHAKEITRLCQKQKKAKEQSHAAMEMMMKKWLAADNIGLLTSAFSDWKREVAISAELEQVHEAAKASVMSWLAEEQEEMKKQSAKSKQRLVGLLASRSGRLAASPGSHKQITN